MPVPLTPDAAARLAGHLEAHRHATMTSVAGAFDVKLRMRAALDAFVERAYDVFAQELITRDGGELDAVVTTAAVEERGLEVAAIFALLVTTVATTLDIRAFTDPHQRAIALKYCARRGAEGVRLAEATRVEPGSLPEFEASPPVSRDDVVAALVAAVDARDQTTGEHCRAVGSWSGRIASMLGLSADAQRFATLCGTLHDIGKIAMPTQILGKPGPLDDDEWVVMRAHARTGATMLERIPSLKDVAPIVRVHHERVDGKGYPDGIRGGEIPLVARIVAASDAFHAMISKRPYRDPLSVAEAAEQLLAGRGTQWDATVVDAIIGLVRPVSVPVELPQTQWNRRR